MKSTIKIGFTGPSNEPVIRVEKRYSDDLRDIMVSQFFERLYGESTLCHIMCVGTDAQGSSWEIQPLPPNSHYICLQRVEEMFHCMRELHPELCMITNGEEVGFCSNALGSPNNTHYLNREDLRNMNIIDLYNEVTKTIENVINNKETDEHTH